MSLATLHVQSSRKRRSRKATDQPQRQAQSQQHGGGALTMVRSRSVSTGMHSADSNESDIGDDASSLMHDRPGSKKARRHRRERLPSDASTKCSAVGSEQMRLLFPEMGQSEREALAQSPLLKTRAEYMLSAVGAKWQVNVHGPKYWNEPAVQQGQHIWQLVPSGAESGSPVDCYLVSAHACMQHQLHHQQRNASATELSQVPATPTGGRKQRCNACRLVLHTACIPVADKMGVSCKPTFVPSQLHLMRTFANESVDDRGRAALEAHRSVQNHHWLFRSSPEGKCAACDRSLQQGIFSDKSGRDAVQCSWCKVCYHNKQGCFDAQLTQQICNGGTLAPLITPPAWIVRIEEKTQTARKSGVRGINKAPDLGQSPLIVFVNPKSGGGKGRRLLSSVQWLLNPRQCFDLTVTNGPQFGLRMYQKIMHRCKILVLGGDGTAGWVFSALDEIISGGTELYPPLAALPLGTGNDLARTFGWGGAFSDDPLSSILTRVHSGCITDTMNRWAITVQPNIGVEWSDNEDGPSVVDKLPLAVMNNYFSIGADAHVALQFHQSRSANPEMFNSRLKNRMVYGGLGTVDLFKRTWRNLSEHIYLECDGLDVTDKIKDYKLHCILFHNIPYYAGGVQPWPTDSATRAGMGKAAVNDGKIEVIGFTTKMLAALQLGGKGIALAQCRTARLTTGKAIPAQVDGEPCLLAPSVVRITPHNTVPILRCSKRSTAGSKVSMMSAVGRQPSGSSQAPCESGENVCVLLRLPVLAVSRADLTGAHSDIDSAAMAGWLVGHVCAPVDQELAHVRPEVERIWLRASSTHNRQQSCEKSGASERQCPPSWRFIDYKRSRSEGHCMRIAHAREAVTTLADACDPERGALMVMVQPARCCHGLAKPLSVDAPAINWSPPLRIVLTGYMKEVPL